MLKKSLLTLLFTSSLILPVSAEGFYGTYLFSDKDFTNGTADQKIEYKTVKKSPILIFHGVESAGEGCCAYFKQNAKNLKTDKKGNISFEIGLRDLYMTRESIGKKSGDGMSAAVLKFKGKFDKKGLTLNCSSESGYDCYISKPINFKKIK